MIHHLSLPAKDPERVATVLAGILDGKATPLFPDTGTWCAWSKDDYGTCIEIYPHGFTMQPGTDNDAVEMKAGPQAEQYTESHAAISVDLSVAELIDVGEREGWRVLEHNRGPFRVVEFWLENKVLIEFLTPEMKEEYASAISAFARSDWTP